MLAYEKLFSSEDLIRTGFQVPTASHTARVCAGLVFADRLPATLVHGQVGFLPQAILLVVWRLKVFHLCKEAAGYHRRR